MSLNEFGDIVTALSTFAVFAATVVLAIYTRMLAKQTNRPFVVLWLRSNPDNPSAMKFALVNSGNGTAFDIQTKIDPAPKVPNSKTKEAQNEFVVSMLPPGAHLGLLGVLSFEVYEQRFNVSISWSERPGSKRRESVSYSLRPHDGYQGGFTEKGLHSIASELEKIAKVKK